MAHVREGCLTRTRQDIRADGSRIEGTHKGWNGIQRSFASGLDNMIALSHDFVLRRNQRVESSGSSSTKPLTAFTASTFGSHHIRLVNAYAVTWNNVLKGRKTLPAGIEVLPTLSLVASGESFGLVRASASTAAHYSLVEVKEEPADDLFDLSSQSLLDATQILRDLGIDPTLAHQLPQNTASASTPRAHTHALTQTSSNSASFATTAGMSERGISAFFHFVRPSLAAHSAWLPRCN